MLDQRVATSDRPHAAIAFQKPSLFYTSTLEQAFTHGLSQNALQIHQVSTGEVNRALVAGLLII